MLTRSSEWIFNPMHYTCSRFFDREICSQFNGENSAANICHFIHLINLGKLPTDAGKCPTGSCAMTGLLPLSLYSIYKYDEDP